MTTGLEDVLQQQEDSGSDATPETTETGNVEKVEEIAGDAKVEETTTITDKVEETPAVPPDNTELN